MIINLSDYNYGYKIVSLAKDEYAKEELLKKFFNVLFIKNDKAYFIDNNAVINLNEENIKKFKLCSNYDVFEISKDGKAFQYYNNNSLDNAIMITNKCNSNCLMCPMAEVVRKKGTIASIEELLEIVQHIPNDAVHLTITGGEPFLLKKDIFILLEYIKNKFSNTRFLLLTNGRALADSEYCKLFCESIPQNTIVGIPLHGFDSYSHDFITQSRGSFKQTFKGLKGILSKNIKVELRIVISKLNIDYIDKIANIIASEFPNVLSVKFIGLEMLGNAAKNEKDVWISYTQAFQGSKSAIQTLIKNNIDVGIYNFPLCAVEKEYWYICEKSITDYKIRYLPKCDYCKVKDACGGIFAGTIRLVEKSISPIG